MQDMIESRRCIREGTTPKSLASKTLDGVQDLEVKKKKGLWALSLVLEVRAAYKGTFRGWGLRLPAYTPFGDTSSSLYLLSRWCVVYAMHNMCMTGTLIDVGSMGGVARPETLTPVQPKPAVSMPTHMVLEIASRCQISS